MTPSTGRRTKSLPVSIRTDVQNVEPVGIPSVRSLLREKMDALTSMRRIARDAAFVWQFAHRMPFRSIDSDPGEEQGAKGKEHGEEVSGVRTKKHGARGEEEHFV